MKTDVAPLRILIADDHDVMREGTRAVIERQPGWEVCGIAATGREAVNQAVALEPDIVVMDMTMPELNGLDAAVQIKRRLPKTEILIFTGNASDQLIREVFEAGADSLAIIESILSPPERIRENFQSFNSLHSKS